MNLEEARRTIVVSVGNKGFVQTFYDEVEANLLVNSLRKLNIAAKLWTEVEDYEPSRT